MILTRVTFTGVDEKTDINRLVELQEQYPYAEFGILFSDDWQWNGPRFPNPEIILPKLQGKHLNLSAHYCGKLAIAVAHGLPSVTQLPPENTAGFERCQLNMRALGMFEVLRAHKPIHHHKEAILQMHSPEILRQFLQGDLPGHCSYLLDASGGAGIDTPIEIVTHPGVHVGYAGGIGPENVESKLRTLLSHPTEDLFWIDMETRVRTDEWLDLDKVEQVLKTADRVIKDYQII